MYIEKERREKKRERERESRIAGRVEFFGFTSISKDALRAEGRRKSRYTGQVKPRTMEYKGRYIRCNMHQGRSQLGSVHRLGRLVVKELNR